MWTILGCWRNVLLVGVVAWLGGCTDHTATGPAVVAKTGQGNDVAVAIGSDDCDDQATALGDLPQAVRDGLAAAVPGAIIGHVELGTEHGRSVYEAELVQGNQAFEVKTDLLGRLVEIDAEPGRGNGGQRRGHDSQSQRIALADIPGAVLAAINGAAPGGTIRQVELEHEDGAPVYSAELVTVDGRALDVEVDPSGQVLETELGDRDDRNAGDAGDCADVTVRATDLPAAVLAAIEAAIPGGQIDQVELESRDGRVVYDVEANADGQRFALEVDATGRVLALEAQG